MSRLVSLIAWFTPLAVLGGSACSGMWENCGDLGSPPFESGIYRTYERSDAEATVHSGTSDKTLTLDMASRTVVIEYTDRDGRAVVERWTMGPISSGG